MPAQSSPRFPRGFSPFGGSDQNLRVSDAERQAVTDRLATHYADGRLDQAEFDERAGRAMSAKTRGDLTGLLDDLPEPGTGPGPGLAGAPGAAGAPGYQNRPYPATRIRHGHPVLGVIVAVVLISAIGHALWWFAWPLMWLAIIAFIALAATGRTGHHRTHP